VGWRFLVQRDLLLPVKGRGFYADQEDGSAAVSLKG